MALKKKKKLKINKSGGLDEIHPQILKKTVEMICSPCIAIIFNKFIQEGQVPQGRSVHKCLE